MSDLGLSAATEAAARARYERVRRVKLDHGAIESAVPAWDDAAPQIREGWIAGVTEEITAAAPHIEAQVREDVRAASAEVYPSWARPPVDPCLVLTCSGCGEVYDHDDYGTIHHSTIESARDTADGADWYLLGDQMLCPQCQAAIVCEDIGHGWHRYDDPDGQRPPIYGCVDFGCHERTRVPPGSFTTNPDWPLGRPTLYDLMSKRADS